MNTEKTLEVIRDLAYGIDPFTGEEFPYDCQVQHPRTIRALFAAIQLMEKVLQSEYKQKDLPLYAGEPWSEAEDNLLLTAYRAGTSIKKLAQKHKRSEGAIRGRLTKHNNTLL